MAVSEEKENLFGELALARGLITEAQLAQAQRQRQALAAKGKQARLGEVLMKAGVITREQALSVLKEATLAMGGKPTIGGYELQNLLGKGAMGSVYCARQVSMDRLVALKLLPQELGKNEEFVKRFMREARTTAKLSHKNIISAFDVGESNGYYYFAMELVKGEALDEVLKREGKLPPPRAVELALQVVAGLEHASSQGIIHRDIKPANVMLDEHGVAKIADMGLAVAAGGKTSEHMTGTGIAVGTPYYMSPEQVEGRHDIDFRADIYALGGTLYEMVTGKKPFDAANVPAIMALRLYEEAKPAAEVEPAVGAPLSAVIRKMMAREPKNRYQDFASLRQDLQKVLSGERPACLSAAAARKGAEKRKPAPAAAKAKKPSAAPRKHATASAEPKRDKRLLYGGAAVAALAALLIVGAGVKAALYRKVPAHPHPESMQAALWQSAAPAATPGEQARDQWLAANLAELEICKNDAPTTEGLQSLRLKYKAIADAYPGSVYKTMAEKRMQDIDRLLATK